MLDVSKGMTAQAANLAGLDAGTYKPLLFAHSQPPNKELMPRQKQCGRRSLFPLKRNPEPCERNEINEAQRRSLQLFGNPVPLYMTYLPLLLVLRFVHGRVPVRVGKLLLWLKRGINKDGIR